MRTLRKAEPPIPAPTKPRGPLVTVIERMDVRLPPFDPDARCVKCDYDAIGTEWTLPEAPAFLLMGIYMDDMVWVADFQRMLAEQYPKGTMERKCHRCGWSWQERPVDA